MISTAISSEEQRAMDAVRTKLEATYSDLGSATVQAAIDDAHRRFDGRKIRDFVPLFVERVVSQQLSQVSA